MRWGFFIDPRAINILSMYICIREVNYLQLNDKLKVTSWHVLIDGHCPLLSLILYIALLYH